MPFCSLFMRPFGECLSQAVGAQEQIAAEMPMRIPEEIGARTVGERVRIVSNSVRMAHVKVK